MKICEKIHPKVLIYLDELKKWSNFFNLHSFDEKDLEKEVWEVSTYFVKEIKNTATAYQICDIGSGGGIPGIVIKILLPESEMLLIESNRKKAHFLKKTIHLLKLKKISVLNQDVRQVINANSSFNFVTSRAFGLKFPEYALKLLKKGGDALYFVKKNNKKFKIEPAEVKKCPLGYILKWVK